MKPLLVVLTACSLLALGLGCGRGENLLPPAAGSQHPDSLRAVGWNLLASNCFSCHHPDPSNTVGVAPNMAEVRAYYLGLAPDSLSFTSAIATFLMGGKPQMQDAMARFGPMPSGIYQEAQYRAVAAYLWATDMAQPGWMSEVYPRDKLRYADTGSLPPLERGMQHVMAVKSVLGKNLLNAVQQRGSHGAVDFCSTRALPITDSMAVHLGVAIRRVSDRNRNPANAASADEQAYLLECRQKMNRGEKPAPRTVTIDGRPFGYYPILTDEMCLQCHGMAGKEIAAQTQAVIREKYPNDLATGFARGDLWGMWVVGLPVSGTR